MKSGTIFVIQKQALQKSNPAIPLSVFVSDMDLKLSVAKEFDVQF